MGAALEIRRYCSLCLDSFTPCRAILPFPISFCFAGRDIHKIQSVLLKRDTPWSHSTYSQLGCDATIDFYPFLG
jgi:hypothetical protein